MISGVNERCVGLKTEYLATLLEHDIDRNASGSKTLQISL